MLLQNQGVDCLIIKVFQPANGEGESDVVREIVVRGLHSFYNDEEVSFLVNDDELHENEGKTSNHPNTNVLDSQLVEYRKQLDVEAAKIRVSYRFM